MHMTSDSQQKLHAEERRIDSGCVVMPPGLHNKQKLIL